MLINSSTFLSKISIVADFEEKRLLYSTQTDEQRYYIWYTYLESKLNSLEYTDIQKAAILTLKNKLNINLFKDTDERIIFQEIWLPQWIKFAKNLFSDIQIYNLAFNIQITQDVSPNFQTNTNKLEIEVQDCTCKQGSSYTCPRLVGGIIPFIQYGDCSFVNKCNNLIRGCGAFFDDECDGSKCSYPILPI